MKRIIPARRIVLFVVVLFGYVLFECLSEISAFAESSCGGVATSLINCDENEGGIWHILNMIIELFSIGVGLLGVIGISIVGIQILNAKDSPEQVKKAKVRFAQIVLGLALYSVLFLAAEWLLPGGFLSSESGLQNVGSTSQVKEQERIREEARQKTTDSNGASSPNQPNASEQQNNSVPKSKQIASLAWKIGKNKISYDSVADATGYYSFMSKNCHAIGGGDCDRGKKGYRTFCSGFVYNVLRYSGADPKYPMMLTGKQMSYANKSKLWKNITDSVNGKTSKLKPGDVLINNGHTLIITENSKGKLYTAQAAVGNFEPSIRKISSNTKLDNSAGNLSKYQVFRIVE